MQLDEHSFRMIWAHADENGDGAVDTAEFPRLLQAIRRAEADVSRGKAHRPQTSSAPEPEMAPARSTPTSLAGARPSHRSRTPPRELPPLHLLHAATRVAQAPRAFSRAASRAPPPLPEP